MMTPRIVFTGRGPQSRDVLADRAIDHGFVVDSGVHRQGTAFLVASDKARAGPTRKVARARACGVPIIDYRAFLARTARHG